MASKKEITESHLAKLETELWAFKNSSDIVFQFPSSVNNYERKKLHDSAKNLGLWGQSFGRKTDRTLHVFRTPLLKQTDLTQLNQEDSDVRCRLGGKFPDNVSYVEFDAESRAALQSFFSEYVEEGWVECMDHMIICGGSLMEAKTYDDRGVSDIVRKCVQGLRGGTSVALRVTSVGRDLGVCALGVVGCHTMNQTAHVAVAYGPGHSISDSCSITDWERLPEDKLLPLFGIIRDCPQATMENCRDNAEVSFRPPLFVLRKSGAFSGDLHEIASQVFSVLRERDWAGACSAGASALDVSGFGCGKTYKVVCEGGRPPAVALHVLGESEDVGSKTLARIGKAAEVFANAGLAPGRLAHGEGWFIEQWGGVTLKPTPTSRLGSVKTIREIGGLLAKIHSISPTWYDEWREQLCTNVPGLCNADIGSHIWWYANAPRNDKLPNLTSDALARWIGAKFFAPVTSSAARVVTCHGDFHPANIIRIQGVLKAIDFEFAGAYAAVHDFAWVFTKGWLADKGEKEAFVKGYLEASNLPAVEADVRSFLLDAEIASIGSAQFVLWPGLERKSLDGCDTSYKNPSYPHPYEDFIVFVQEVRSKPELQANVIDNGLRASMDKWFQMRDAEKRKVERIQKAMLDREEGLRRKALTRGVCVCCNGDGSVIVIGNCPLCDGAGVLQ